MRLKYKGMNRKFMLSLPIDAKSLDDIKRIYWLFQDQQITVDDDDGKKVLEKLPHLFSLVIDPGTVIEPVAEKKEVVEPVQEVPAPKRRGRPPKVREQQDGGVEQQ